MDALAAADSCSTFCVSLWHLEHMPLVPMFCAWRRGEEEGA